MRSNSTSSFGTHIGIKLILLDMLDAISGIESFIYGLSETEFLSDTKTQAAVERYLEILGEAANKLPDIVYQHNQQIEWHKIISLRNRIIHAYFDVNKAIIWNIAKKFLPKLKDDLEKIVSKY